MTEPGARELLPCPFCGGEAYVMEEDGRASCFRSGCAGYTVVTPPERWNRRAAAPERAPDGWILRNRETGELCSIVVQHRSELANSLGARIGTQDVVPVYIGAAPAAAQREEEP